MFSHAVPKDIILVLQESTMLREIKMKLIFVKDIHEFTRVYETLANSKLISVTIDNQLDMKTFQAVHMLLCDKKLPKNSTVNRSMAESCATPPPSGIPVDQELFLSLGKIIIIHLSFSKIKT